MAGNGVLADGGGYWVVNGRIVKVPPWEPMVANKLRAVATLVRAQQLLAETELAGVVDDALLRVNESVVADVERTAGDAGAEDVSFVYFSDDGGFCGTVPPRRPPMPVPWPRPLPANAFDKVSIDG